MLQGNLELSVYGMRTFTKRGDAQFLKNHKKRTLDVSKGGEGQEAIIETLLVCFYGKLYMCRQLSPNKKNHSSFLTGKGRGEKEKVKLRFL